MCPSNFLGSKWLNYLEICSSFVFISFFSGLIIINMKKSALIREPKSGHFSQALSACNLVFWKYMTICDLLPLYLISVCQLNLDTRTTTQSDWKQPCPKKCVSPSWKTFHPNAIIYISLYTAIIFILIQL